MLQVANSQTDYNAAACKIWMCKGYKYADNTANVQKYTAGQTVPITVDIRAPHTGVANVSIVATANNKMISSELISWTNYASNAATIPEGQKQFNIVMPSNLGTQCNTPGACIIQWFWDAADINQTYESCIDFTLSGGSGANTKVATTVAATTPAKTTAVQPTSTKAPVASTCACAPVKRDALAQDSYCQASTVTISSVSTITQTATVYPSSSSVGSVSSVEAIASYSVSVSTSVVTSTITAEITQTVTATVTVTPSLSAPTSVAAVATSSSKCTTSITLTRASASSSIVAPVGTGAPYPIPSSNATTAAPTAPSVSLAPVYSSALANLTSALATGALTSVVPSASVNPIISSYIANLTSILPTGVLPTGTIPTALPSGYATMSAAPTASAPAYGGGSNTAPASGMTLQQILDWLAYIVKQVFQEGEKAGQSYGATASSSSVVAPVETAAPAGYEKRNHARSFMG